MPALALTDQSNLFALVKFYRAAEANGIKPIAGADLWIDNPAEPGAPTQLTLLCQNRRGYLNLAQLISRSYIEGRHGDFAIVDPDWLAGHSDGLIALAGRRSDVGPAAARRQGRGRTGAHARMAAAFRRAVVFRDHALRPSGRSTFSRRRAAACGHCRLSGCRDKRRALSDARRFRGA
jgi:DNA polymerase-3 subunit alpha